MALDTSTRTAVSSEIRAHLARAQHTQSQLATRLGISQSQVSARLRGDVSWRVDELLTIAAWLGVRPSILLGEAA